VAKKKEEAEAAVDAAAPAAGAEKGTESSLLKHMLSGARKEFGGRCFIGSDTDKLLLGIELPALCLKWLLDMNVLPLSKCIGVAGAYQTNKSSLGFEIIRWIIDAGGAANFDECEGAKFSPSLARSIIGPRYDSRFIYTQCLTVQDAQQSLTEKLKDYKKYTKRDELFGFLLDSISGSATEETVKKLEKEGSMSRSFPTAALAWNDFFKAHAARLVSWPATFVYINHLKEVPQTVASGAIVQRTPGGTAQSYHASFYLYVYRLGSGDQKQTLEVDEEVMKRPHEVRPLIIRCHKNSLGTENRMIQPDFIFWKDEQNNQTSYFDWDAATARLLSSLQDDKPRGIDKDAVRDTLDVRVNNNRYWSKRLGVSNVMASTFGKAVHADKVLMAELEKALCIRQFPIWNGHMPELLIPPDPEEEEDEGKEGKKKEAKE
jgi:hypothetical protein